MFSFALLVVFVSSSLLLSSGSSFNLENDALKGKDDADESEDDKYGKCPAYKGKREKCYGCRYCPDGSLCSKCKSTISPSVKLPTYYMFTHGPPGGNIFFDSIKVGALDAALQLKDKIKLVYQNVGVDDGPAQAAIIKSAVDAGAAGIATTLANKEALEVSLAYAHNKSVPVVLFNSGIDYFKFVNALTGYGSNETLAGTEAGDLLKKAGGKKMLCVVTELFNIGLDERCNAAAIAFEPGVTTIIKHSNLTDLNSFIGDILTQNPDIDTYLASKFDALVAYNTWLTTTPSPRAIYAGTFDESPLVSEMFLRNPSPLLFAISQQPYQQGYYPILALHVWNNVREVLGGGGVVLTGPIAKFGV